MYDLDQFLHQCCYFLLASQDQKIKSSKFQNLSIPLKKVNFNMAKELISYAISNPKTLLLRIR